MRARDSLAPFWYFSLSRSRSANWAINWKLNLKVAHVWKSKIKICRRRRCNMNARILRYTTNTRISSPSSWNWRKMLSPNKRCSQKNRMPHVQRWRNFVNSKVMRRILRLPRLPKLVFPLEKYSIATADLLTLKDREAFHMNTLAELRQSTASSERVYALLSLLSTCLLPLRLGKCRSASRTRYFARKPVQGRRHLPPIPRTGAHG